MWIVMSSSAHMPQTCWGRYRNVALVKLTPEYAAKKLFPRMISQRANGVEQVIKLGKFFVGDTEKCAYMKAMRQAREMARQYNERPQPANGENK